MATDKNIDHLILNRLTKEQYEAIEEPNEDELYFVPDEGGDEKPYLSIERNGEYLYTVTFDDLPEMDTNIAPAFGGCTSWVRNGKLYRNLDWKYDENLSFRVITKDFEGMSFIEGLTNDNLDDAKIAQLPYHVVDGINKQGIMIATHVLYNDWNWAGTGDTPLTKLPYLVLENVKSMATITTDLADILDDLYVPEAMEDMEYLLQIIVTDGSTTCVIAPSTGTSGAYTILTATSNPKLTNFRWVSSVNVSRSSLQTRPNGVERWNSIDVLGTTLKDLRYTVAYENTSRLSDFIGIDGTTKSSTDAELTEIHNEARAEYLVRTRNGATWQTMHSVVYNSKSGMEELYTQENWNRNYAKIALYDTTGQNTNGAMTQKAATEMVFSDVNRTRIQIGRGAEAGSTGGIAIGDDAKAGGCVVIGRSAHAWRSSDSVLIGYSAVDANVYPDPTTRGCIALGARSGQYLTEHGVMDISSRETSYGFRNSKFRLLTGVHDGISAYDACTKGQLDTAIASVATNEITNSDWSNLWQ